MSHTQLATVDFHGHSLAVIADSDQRLVAMKPICENIGLDWAAQFSRIKRDEVLNSTIVVMTTVAQDGKLREFTCLPLDYINGWLFGIDVKRCREEIRPTLIQYKRECYTALAAYWQDGIAGRPTSILGQTIGTDGFHMLGSLIKGKVSSLPAPVQRRATMKIWSQTHAAFGVRSAADIPADLLDSARNFIAAYTLEGEWLPKPEKRCGTLFDDYQLYDVYFVCHHFGTLYEIFKRHKLYSFLKTHGSSAGVEMIDHFKDGSMAVWKLSRDFGGEFDAVQSRLRLNQHRARNAAM